MRGRGRRSARWSDRRHARQSLEQQADDGSGGTGARQVDGDPGLHLDDAGGDLDEAQAQGVELGAPPGRAAGQRGAQGPQKPVGAGVQEQAELVGGGAGAGSSVGSEVGLPRLDVVLGLAPRAVELFVDRLTGPLGQAGDDEAGVAAARPNLDAGDDALDAAPGGGGVVELLEPPDRAVFGGRGARRSV
jgi:hypothetical protein